MEKTFSCHCMTLRYAAQTLTEAYDRALEGSGLKVTQYTLLRCIIQEEQEEAEQSLTDLAQKLGSDRSTIGRNVRILERDELVSLSKGSDRREHTVHITQKGREAVALATPLWLKSQAAVEERLGEDQLETLRAMLAQLGEIHI